MNTWVIARTTFGDSLRRRVLLIFLLLAFVMLTLALLLNYFTAREQSTIFKSTQLVIILIFGALISITTAVYLVPNEIDRRTIYSVLAKPVQRWEFLLGKFLGGALTVGFMIGLMSLALMLVLSILALKPPSGAADVQQLQEASAGVNVKDWLTRSSAEIMLVIRAVLVIYFQLVVVTAIATTLSLYLAPTVNFGVTAIIWILGQFQDALSGVIEDRTPLGFAVRGVSYVVPHFHDFNIMGSIIHPAQIAKDFDHWGYALGVCSYGLFWSLGVLMIGVLVFDRKEV